MQPQENQPQEYLPQPKLNKWKPIAITFIALTAILIGLTAFFCLKDTATDNDKQDCEDIAAGQPNDSDIPEIIDETDNYLIITEWGIKFPIPEGLENPIYSFADHGPNTFISINTPIFSAIADCHNGLGALSRSTAEGERPFNYYYDGYYYFYEGPHAPCTNEAQNLPEGTTIGLIKAMLTVPFRAI